MTIKNRSFPRWAGPLVGAGAGVVLAFRFARRQNQAISTEWLVIGGAVIGAVAGSIVSLLDRPKPDPSLEVAPLDGAAAGTLPGRFMAVLGVLLCWVPALGLAIGGIAWFVNRKVAGWPRKASIAATVIAILITILLIVIAVLDPGKTGPR